MVVPQTVKQLWTHSQCKISIDHLYLNWCLFIQFQHFLDKTWHQPPNDMKLPDLGECTFSPVRRHHRPSFHMHTTPPAGHWQLALSSEAFPKRWHSSLKWFLFEGNTEGPIGLGKMFNCSWTPMVYTWPARSNAQIIDQRGHWNKSQLHYTSTCGTWRA